MADDTGQVRITFNGEIYNFQEVARELETKGYRFKSRTDTEVILYAYREWDTDCLRKFNGMFAFAVYDDRKKVLFLARDRVGKKPLYYIHRGGEFLFASEIKALALEPGFDREINLDALSYFLTYGYIPGEMCIFSGVRKLPSAHALTYSLDTGEIKRWRYWQVPPEDTGAGTNEDQVLEELEALLEDSVRLRMISDVPLGVFLSGGVDSSLVTALMAKISDRPVKTFSVGFEDQAFNELPHARIVADHFRTEHTEILVKPDFFNILPKLCVMYDEPFADNSMIPTYYVSRETRKYVTVALAGDGGDELFGGYTTYLAGKGIEALTGVLPRCVRSSLAAAGRRLPEKWRWKRHLERLSLDGMETFLEMAGHPYFHSGYKAQVLSRDIIDLLGARLYMPETQRLAALRSENRTLVNNLEYHDFMTYLPDDILVKVDRASMLNSLEVRAPLLDYRIAELALGRIPPALKIRGTNKKYLLKKMAAKLLPPRLNIHRKQGFAVPVSRWFRGPLYAKARETLLGRDSRFLDRNAVARLLDEHRDGVDHGGRLFVLMVFMLWAQTYDL